MTMRNSTSKEEGDVVTPWTVHTTSKTGIDYAKLIVRFGSSAIPPDMCERFEQLTNGTPAHYLLRRGVFFSHREFDEVLETYSKGTPFYLYTGRGPSSEAMHTGHLIPFIFTKWLQETFDIPLVIQLTDDEKFLWKNLTVQHARHLAHENAKDIIALGFDPNKTLIFNDFDFISRIPPFYYTIIALQRSITFKQVKSVLSIQTNVNPDENEEQEQSLHYDSESIGRIAYSGVKCAAALPCSILRPLRGISNAIRSLIVCPHGGSAWTLFAQLLRGSLHPADETSGKESLTCVQPAVLGYRPLPGLQSVNSIMDPNEVNSAVHLNDSAKNVKDKINKYAFSGGGVSKEEHEKNGGNCDVDVAFQMLRYLLPSDERLNQIETEYRSGKLLTGFLKKELIDLLNEMFREINERRAALTDEDMKSFLPNPQSATLNFEMDSVVRTCEPVAEKPELCPLEIMMTHHSLKDQKTPLHQMIRRGLIDAQLDLDQIMSAVQNQEVKDSFYIFYSHCPSSKSLHLGEIVPLLFVKWLQEYLGGVHVVIHITDDEHYFMQPVTIEGDALEGCQKMGLENKRDIIALGFNADRTLIFTSSEVMTPFFENVTRVQKRVTFNQVKGIFGFSERDWIGKIGFPAVQASPCFSSGFPEIFESANNVNAVSNGSSPVSAPNTTQSNEHPSNAVSPSKMTKSKKGKKVTTESAAPISTRCSDIFCLIPCAIDQDPFFRMTRDVAPRLGLKKPTLIHSTFFPALQGGETKMSASEPNSAIFVIDSLEMVREKIENHAFCNPCDRHEDIPYQYLRHFSGQEEKLMELQELYESGNVDIKAVKEELIQCLWVLLDGIQSKRRLIDDKMLHAFLERRPLNFKMAAFNGNKP